MSREVLRNKDKVKWILLSTCCLFFIFFNNEAFSFIYLDNLPDNEPKRILTDQKNRFYIDYGSRISVVSNKLEYSVYFRDPKKNFGGGSVDSEISPDGRIHAIIKSSFTPKKSKTTYYRLNIAECVEGVCQYQLLANWSSGKTSTYYRAEKLRVSKNGEVYFSVTKHYKSGEKWLTRDTYYLNKKSVLLGAYQAVKFSDQTKNKSGVEIVSKNGIGSNGIYFEVNGEILTLPEDRSSRYTRSHILDANEIPHVFFHDPVSRSFYHHFFSIEQNRIIEVMVDYAESGGENTLFSIDEEIWSVHYFYRDSFNKGLLVTIHDINNGEIKEKFTLDASETRNTGWDLLGGQSSENRILLSYISDKISSKREYVILENVTELKTELGKNFSQFGHPKGDGYLQHIPKIKRKEHIALLNSSSTESIRSGYLNIGFGIQNVNWIVNSAVPDEDSSVSTPYEPEYNLSASILSSFSIEGKIGSTNFGLDYATKLIDQEAEKSDSDNAKAFSKITGKIGWEKLIFNYDFAFQYEKSNSEVIFIDNSGQIPSKTFDIKFREMKFSLLTMKRNHFGYIYQTYNFYQPVYIYSIAKDATAYNFVSQAIGDINAKNHIFHFGSSTVNYITKYETQYNSWFFDWELRGGLSIAEFDGNIVLTGNKTPTSEYGFMFAGQVEAGYIWYKRWKSFYQFGGVIKLSYRIDGSKIGSSKKPEDKDEPSTKDDYVYQFERSEIRHGPMIFVSLNF